MSITDNRNTYVLNLLSEWKPADTSTGRLEKPSNPLEVTFHNPIVLERDAITSGPSREVVGYRKWQVALTGLTFYNLIQNVSKSLGNDTINYTWNGSNYSITLEDGLYAIDMLNQTIQTILLEREHVFNPGSNPIPAFTITPYLAIGRVFITVNNPNSISPPPCTIDIANSSLRNLLGFDINIPVLPNPSDPVASQYTYYGDHRPNFDMNITEYKVRVNILEDSPFTMTDNADVLYSFNIHERPSSQITIKPSNSVFLPVRPGNLNHLKIAITDQNGNIINIRSDISYQLLFKKDSF